jgi:magnesium-transporting ATPase (P-type)
MFSFNSERKTMSTIVKRPDSKQGGSYRMFTKGAAEIVVKRCKHLLLVDGTQVPMDARSMEDIQQTIVNMAKLTLRTICIAYRDYAEGELPENLSSLEQPPDDDLVCCAIFGIMDPLRPDVTESVEACRKAGVMVRMVTGDNIHTAKAIAKQCGILTADGVALEGPVFRTMAREELAILLPKLQVLMCP